MCVHLSSSSIQELNYVRLRLFFYFYFLCGSGEDPETRRLRTVKNIADLRQNLEETMSSLRGTQVTHR